MENKKLSLREILACVVFIGMIGVFFILNFVIPAPTVLIAERRAPARFPELSTQSILSGTFMSGFENYAADRFVFRDSFRTIKAFFVFDIYQMTDKSGLYNCDAVGVGQFRRVDATAFRQTSERILRAAQSLEGQDVNIFYSIVPDKSIFADRFMPGFDLAQAESILDDVLGAFTYISLKDSLSAASFYRTDLHWDQAEIAGVTSVILEAMGADYRLSDFPIRLVGEWNGVYSGQLALPVLPDQMRIVDISGISVRYLNDRTLVFDHGPVYDHDRFAGIDPYDIFLRGPQPLIVLENDSATTDRKLYLFRDSFGSSLAPLMMEAYAQITVIDLRYINLLILDQFVDFVPSSDVLFIFSSQIFNNPTILQTQ